MTQLPRPAAVGYTEVLAGDDHRVARSLIGILLLSVGAVLVAPLLLVPLLYLGLWLEGGSAPLAEQVARAFDGPVTASYLLYANLTIAALIPLSWLLVRFLHGVRPRWLTSVAPGLRWRLLLVCLGLSVVSLVLALVVGSGLPIANQAGVTEGAASAEVGSSVALVAVVVLLTTPLQVIGEEYGYRGYLMQAVGALSGRPWVAVGVSAVVFALAHGSQNFPLFFDRLAFGVIAGTTVVLLGGLEAGIAMHLVNNAFVFAIAIATDSVTDTLAISAVSWWQILVTLTQQGSYLVLVLIAARELGVRRTTQPGVVSDPGPA